MAVAARTLSGHRGEDLRTRGDICQDDQRSEATISVGADATRLLRGYASERLLRLIALYLTKMVVSKRFANIAAMCGDGANDCGALRAAHAGISLSEAESR